VCASLSVNVVIPLRFFAVAAVASERLRGMAGAPRLETYRSLLHGPEREPELLP
jgi:hypothetical protein